MGTPLASVVIVSTLALGIALDTAIFTVVDAVLFEPLPYKDPARLFYVNSRWTAEGVERAHHSGADFEHLRRATRAFEDVAAVVSIRQNLTGIEPPLQVQVGWASRNLFRLLGVSPALGPGFTEDAPPGTLVLSYSFWQDVFGGREDVVGAVVRLDDHPYTVAGVLPRGFELRLPRFPARVDVWKVPDDWWKNGDVWSRDGLDFAILDLIGRLAPGATTAEARDELNAIALGLRETRTEYARAGLEYEPVLLQDWLVGGVRPQLLLLFGAVALVLLVACANVASLMLSRARGRARELGLRMALGSSRGRIARLLLTEALVYALAGSRPGSRRFRTSAPPDSSGRFPSLDVPGPAPTPPAE
jgi:putative ABC transport system permease protein